MGQPAAPDPGTVDQLDQTGYEWYVHPAAKYPARTTGALVVIGMLMGAVYSATDQVIYAAVVLGVLLVTLSPFFQRSAYRISAAGVTRRIMGRSRMIAWRDIRQVVPSAGGVYVSPVPRAAWWDQRGVYLLYANNKEEVLARLKKGIVKIEADAGRGV